MKAKTCPYCLGKSYGAAEIKVCTYCGKEIEEVECEGD